MFVKRVMKKIPSDINFTVSIKIYHRLKAKSIHTSNFNQNLHIDLTFSKKISSFALLYVYIEEYLYKAFESFHLIFKNQLERNYLLYFSFTVLCTMYILRHPRLDAEFFFPGMCELRLFLMAKHL